MGKNLVLTVALSALTAPLGQADHTNGYAVQGGQMILTMDDYSLKCYDTDELSALDVDGEGEGINVIQKSGEWSDAYAGDVRAINFSAVGDDQDVSGKIVNGGVEIIESKPWFESLYARWNLTAGAASYNVYVKEASQGVYTRVDRELVRNYGDYGRVDIPGLPEGTYSIKIVAATDTGAELDGLASEVTDLKVRSYDRSGFTFKDYDGGIGAYAPDGSLKPDARVIYVTAETAKTVRCRVRQSNKDGEGTEFIGLQAIINAYQKGVETRPLAVRLLGLIEEADMDELLSSAEGLQVKGKNNYSPMNITIEGVGEEAGIRGFGVLIRNCSSVEFRNFAVMLCRDDCLSFDTGNSHCWVHNMDFFYGNTGGDSDQAKGDGTVDLKSHSKYITIAYNRFWDCGKTSLCGMKSESTDDCADYHHNWFDHSDSRHPRVRTMTVHVWNNYYDGVAKYGVGATMGSSIFVESNFFRATPDDMLISRQGTDAKGSGTFSGENGGMIKSYGNVYADKGSNSNYTVITQLMSPTSFDCFQAATRDEKVPDTFKALYGGTTYNNFDTDPAWMYPYSPLPAIRVPACVTGYFGAGRLNHGAFRFDLNYPGADCDYGVKAELKAALRDYTPAHFSIF